MTMDDFDETAAERKERETWEQANAEEEAEHDYDAAVEDEAETIPDLAADTLSGDVRDTFLGWFRSARKPWEQMSEAEQTELVNLMDSQAAYLVEECTRVITSFRGPRCGVTVGQLTIKDKTKLEAKITATNTEAAREALGGHVGDAAILVFLDAGYFLGERAPAAIDRDQKAMDFEKSAPAAAAAKPEVDAALNWHVDDDWMEHWRKFVLEDAAYNPAVGLPARIAESEDHMTQGQAIEVLEKLADRGIVIFVADMHEWRVVGLNTATGKPSALFAGYNQVPPDEAETAEQEEAAPAE